MSQPLIHLASYFWQQLTLMVPCSASPLALYQRATLPRPWCELTFGWPHERSMDWWRFFRHQMPSSYLVGMEILRGSSSQAQYDHAQLLDVCDPPINAVICTEASMTASKSLCSVSLFLSEKPFASYSTSAA